MRDVAAMLVSTLVFAVIVVAVLFGVASACWNADPPGSVSVAPTATQTSREGGDDNPQTSPTTSIVTVTPEATQTAVPEATATSPPPSPTQPPAPPTSPPPAPTSTPPPAPTAPPAAPPAALANYSGVWQISDTVTQGAGVGQTHVFVVSLTQQGDQLSGGNSEIVISGYVSGQTAVAGYVQPPLGYTGTFTWTMSNDGNAYGSFTNSLPNAGTSTLMRLQ
jgi:hypothetical protein